MTTVTGGWQVVADGEGTSQGESVICSAGGDPSIYLGIVSSSSLFGPGIVSDEKSGEMDIDVPLGGYELFAGFDGDVKSSLVLDGAGTGYTTSFVEASATGLSTGGDTYDIFGSADLGTKGYIVGEGVGEAEAQGSSSYKVTKIGVPTEVWGEVTGNSNLRLEGFSSSSLASTGGAENGLHTDSRAARDASGDEISTSTSSITSYGSVINGAKANVSSWGTAQGGAWDSEFGSTKEKLANENVASSVTGKVWGYAESNGYLDSADVSAILECTTSKGSDLYVSGGPAGYAASTQNSTAERTYAETWVEDATWGSVARDGKGATAVHWGHLSDLGSGAHTYGPDASAISFGKIFMTTDYRANGTRNESMGYLTLETYAEATKGKVAFAGTLIGHDGDGTIRSEDGQMLNNIEFVGVGNLYHFSYIEAAVPHAETHNMIGAGSVSTWPQATESVAQPYNLSTLLDPNYAWSRTEVYYQNSI